MEKKKRALTEKNPRKGSKGGHAAEEVPKLSLLSRVRKTPGKKGKLENFVRFQRGGKDV